MWSAVALGLVVLGHSPEVPRGLSSIPTSDTLGLFADRSEGEPEPSARFRAEADDDGCDLFRRDWLDAPWLGLPEALVLGGSHIDAQGVETAYEQIPRRWDVDADYEGYRYPVARVPGWPSVISGYDLDLPNALQRRGTMRAVGHGGVDLAQAMGAPITMVPLTHQVGDAVVVYVGPLFGNTVVTRHRLREGGGQRDYVLLFGHLSEAAPAMRRGHEVREGELVGLVGDSDSPNLVHLHLEARRVRDGVDASRLGPDTILTRTTVTDPRNVLPPRDPQRRSSACRLRPYRTALGAFTLSAPGPLFLTIP